ncbi:integral membrane protein TerC family protein [Pseudomonas phage COT4]|uniref:Integral membrane protein n=1 Tax=Pseudomonas phage M5.1 TaxID=2873460 RepID=A0AAE8XE15_9CAUD|nr:integral membrane protein [Pseudomonas phage M5.1]UAV89615.1 integral membrane protein [Pseudomonas phage M5.1]UGL61214.1 integral membrane protein TerC family protein [Pseudomonas phage COT4]
MEFLATIEWAAIFKIVMIDLLLGLDNAIVIALAVASLAVSVRGKAIILGTAGAIALRAILLVFATFLLGVPYLKLIAGAYLVFIGYKLLTGHEDDPEVAQKSTIWGAVWTIVVADFMLSLDNVMAVAGAASGTEHSAIYAIAGILFSIPVIVYGASYLTKLMDRFPVIIWIGAGMLGVVGAEMIVSDAHFIEYVGEVNHWIAKAVGATIVVVAAFIAKKLAK